LISPQWVSGNKFKQLQRQIESLRKQLAVTTKSINHAKPRVFGAG